ncbi:MobQ family relaxase [Niveispirillum cyanobacteriorum]|uniref:MobQ family relaxase n=1 Tax=Niveispirillum cyanobacteriorum TaxID=1612173 RepID=UPI001663297A|nr:MobQ family relaxase [Niveispirillum cyanobacteriorum]
MAIYHLSAKVIGRSSGRSTTAAAAYRAGERIEDGRTGQVFDYTRKGGVEHAEIITPANAPSWMSDRAQLWNAVEKVEARKDAQLAREVEFALPRELTPTQRLDLARAFVKEEFVGRGMVADLAIHNPRHPDGQERPHCHVMITMRNLTGEGFGQKNREWNGKDLLEGWRERWAEHANRALERAGYADRIDHRSLEAQGQDREPQPKLGPAATALERRGEPSERGDHVREVAARNAERAALEVERRTIWERLDQVRAALTALRDRAEEGVRKRIETAREVMDAAKQRIDGLLGRSSTRQGTYGGADRDAVLGRPPPDTQPRSQQTPDRDALLGRNPPNAVQSTNREALLGQASGPSDRIEKSYGADNDRDRQ